MNDSTHPPSLAASLGLDARSVRKLVVGLLVLLVVTGVLGYLLRVPLSELSATLVERFGFAGLFVGVIIVDSWVMPPLTHEPLLLFAHAGGLGAWEIFGVASTASVLAGPFGYALGRTFGRVQSVRARLERTALERLMRERGSAVVAAAAITPIPFAVTTWLAGALQTPFVPFLAACLVRILKVALYFGLIVAGWSLSG